MDRPRSCAADMWVGKWLECRVWEEPVEAARVRPERVHIGENTPEWRAWQPHLGRSMPLDKQGGGIFPTGCRPAMISPG
jgi:hypothetical protein